MLLVKIYIVWHIAPESMQNLNVVIHVRRFLHQVEIGSDHGTDDSIRSDERAGGMAYVH